MSRLVVAVLAAAALAVALWTGGCPQGDKTVRIATKPMTEQFILGEMLRQLIENRTDLRVELIKGVGGGTANIHPAMMAGQFDIYPEYTGTAWRYVLKRGDTPDIDRLRAEYVRRYGLRWVGFYGFNNTFALSVRDEVARARNLRACSDLAAAAPDLVFGAEYDFYERDDGYAALIKAYGLRFKKTVDMDIGLKYPALSAGDIDVMTVFTTDGRRADAPLVVLEDDKSFFPSYYCGTVVRDATLRGHPELEQVLPLLNGVLNDADMAALNREVEIAGRGESDVARAFLRQKGLLP